MINPIEDTTLLIMAARCTQWYFFGVLPSPVFLYHHLHSDAIDFLSFISEVTILLGLSDAIENVDYMGMIP